MTTIERITELYETELPKLPIMLPHDEAIQYFERLFMNGNIITAVENEELKGFIEFWKISYEQFGRLCANVTLDHSENLLSGPVCLITRMWISPDERMSHTFYHLASQFLMRNKTAEHFAAMQMQKKHKPLQVYSRAEVLKHYKIQGA